MTVAFALYQQQLPIVVANVDDLEKVDVDYQTLLTNESNSEYLKCLTNCGQLLRRRLHGAVKSAYGSCLGCSAGMGARTLGQGEALPSLDFEYIHAQLIFKKHFK